MSTLVMSRANALKMLQENVCKIVFHTMDGQERHATGTLIQGHLPASASNSGLSGSTKHTEITDATPLGYYDMDKRDFRNFTVDRLVSIQPI